jgi:transcriptional regulator with XRE-family HTH domain
MGDEGDNMLELGEFDVDGAILRLRQEIHELANLQESLDHRLSSGAVRGRVSPVAEAAVDELMSSSYSASSELRERLIVEVDGMLDRRRLRSGLLEPLLRTSREGRGLSLSDLAQAMESDTELLQQLEDGSRMLSPGDEQLVARWLHALDEDNGEALAALERSVSTAPAGAYSGRADESQNGTAEFVSGVLEELKRLRERDH